MNDAERVASYRRLMVGRGGKHSESLRRMRVAKFGMASSSGFLAVLGLLAVVMVFNSGFGHLTDGQSYVTGQMSRAVSMGGRRSDVGRARERPFLLIAPLHASARIVPSNSGRVFAWPTHGTSTYQRAARMARQGDPEAQRFVSRLGDVNPFDAQ